MHAEREAESSRAPEPSRHSTSWWTVGVGAVAVLIAASAAFAASGVVSVGGVIPGDESPAPGHPPSGTDEVVVAVGNTRVAGPWQVTAYDSPSIVDGGDTVQEEGLKCVRLVLLKRPGGSPFAGSGQCGEPRRDGHEVLSVPVKDELGRIEVILWGRAPEDTAAVELAAAGLPPVRSETHDGPPAFRGDIWVLAASPALSDPRIGWIDGSARRMGADRDVSSQLGRGRALAQ